MSSALDIVSCWLEAPLLWLYLSVRGPLLSPKHVLMKLCHMEQLEVAGWQDPKKRLIKEV